ncbi:MAG: ATP-binding protein, partial [Candidatus Omnitrophota bacterium]|nr:ATP-binding protein [Candidatus Omnitrophota bacterium]
MKIILLLIVQVMLITSLVYPEELHKNNGNLRVESLFKGQGQRPVELLDAMTGLANPEPDSVKDSPEAFEFSDPSQGFKGIDFDHFLYCQNLLAGKKIPLEEYERMVESGYIKKFVDEINRDSYNDPRFEIKVIDQNKNPRMQAILEAVSNSLDSLGLEIGQFGWGVKQILSWLEATGIDRIDVWTSRGDKAYQLTILKDCAGQNYIQIKPVLMDEFRKYSVNGAGNGTTVKVSVKRKISSPENIIGLIRGRFPFIKTVNITTQIEDGPVEKVNGFKIIKVIVPKEGINYKDKEKGNKSVHIAITENTITISDNGRGMDAEKLSKMFVPNEGDKTPKPLSAEDIEAEKKKIEVVHISAPDKKVLFSRNGEVIFSAKVPVDIVQAAAMEGGLIVELGRLMSVERSRDNIVIPFNLQGKSGMEIGIEYAIDEIINNQDLTYSEKAGYINTIIIGLDGLIESNENYAYIVRLVRIYAQSALKETIDKLRQEGYVILPHDKQFEQLLIPKNRKAFFLHEKLFDWQGAVSLKESGAEIIPGIERAVIIDGMEFSQPVAMAPFKKEILEQSAVFNPLFNNSEEDELMPLIKTEQFIAVPFTPGTRRLLELARKREKGDLGKEEEEEYKSLVERLNILTAQEVVTSNEVTTPKKNINLSERTGSVESGSGIDADAINSFLVKPLFIPRPGQGPSKIPSDARQKYIMTEKGIMEIGTGRIVADPKKFHIGQRLEPVAYGYYEYSIFPDKSVQLISLNDYNIDGFPDLVISETVDWTYCNIYYVPSIGEG